MGCQASRLKAGATSKAVRRPVMLDNGCDRDKELAKANSCFDLFRLGHEASRDLPCLGSRAAETSDYSWQTYNEILTLSQSVGRYLSCRLGLRPGDMLGTLSVNCQELAILELACYAGGIVIVPLYDTLGSEACCHILRETGLCAMFCGAKQLPDLVRMLVQTSAEDRGSRDRQFHLILPDVGAKESALTVAEAAAGGRLKLHLHRFADAAAACECEEDQIRPLREEQPPPKSGDLAVICYTSGTTGTPKGVMLSHGNLVAGVRLMARTMLSDEFRHPTRLSSTDVYFSYLPMAHILERMCQLFCYRCGVRIGFYRGDRTRLMDDMRACAPTFLAAVPKVLSRLRDAARAAAASSGVKSVILDLAIRAKTYRMSRRFSYGGDTVWDRAVFARVRAALGGRVRFAVVGGAPISAEALQFARVALACPVAQGFGQTETCGVALCQRPGDPSADNTGSPVDGMEVKLMPAEAADLAVPAATAAAPRGELCVRGPTCFSGYFRQPEKTAEALDDDGWVHTGDIAEQKPDGSYRIVDRAKQIFKLAQGEYIAPEKIELAYGLSQYVEQVFVDGSSEQSCLLAVVVPARESAERWAAASVGGDWTLERLCRNCPEFKAEVLKSLTAAGKAKGLAGFEQARDLLLHPESFTPESGFLTPTLKLRRPQLRARFAGDFARMYAAMGASA